MKAIAILIFICAVALGFYEGRLRPRTLIVVVSGTAIMAVSNLGASWPWFTTDPSTWARTYYSGLLQTGAGSLVIHVLPFIFAYLIGKRCRGHSPLVQE
jgi:hypothetical protein